MDPTKSVVTYGFHGVTDIEKVLLQAMIERISRDLPGPVAHVPAHDAQLVFFDDPAPRLDGGRGRLVRMVRDASAQRFSGGLRMPPHVTDLLDIFTDFIQREAYAHTQCGVMKSLVCALHELFQTRGAPHALVDEDGASLVLYPADRQFSWSGSGDKPALSELFQSHRLPGLGLRPWGTSEPGDDRERRSIEPLFWHMGLAHARCGLVPWVGRDDLLKMRAWPYLAGQGPATATRLATALRARPRSVAALADAARVPETDAVAFANAALLCGFVVTATPTDAQAPQRQPPIRDTGAQALGAARLPRILGAIRNALGIHA
ncbi:hypothetical protein [Acidiferrobacter sp. SPIII_3]|uniref:hypothetical protein n=1 Tax=Acidiferrobacter sp. SPIII_3 TaxID=1281578 RepID=UPI0011AB31B5|nr:hypothetical protein [Acidiferrobacter sp. SPIII_3]